jgi:nitrile hydratase alpha subunit
VSGAHTDHNGAAGNGHGHPHPKNELSYWAKRMYAITELLLEKGVITQEDIQREQDWLEARTPANGARLVARAWVDLAFKARLIADPKAACKEMGIDASGINDFVVLENTEQVRHLVVCTLCSCYPRPILGRPPDWYKSLNYRARAVAEPRAVMREFGQAVPDDIEVRVVDSSADIRYLVLPLRPRGTEHLSEDELREVVSRDSLIGIVDPRYDPVPAH